MEITIDEAGEVEKARAVLGHALLRDACVSAARQWKFAPAKLTDSPSKVVSALTFEFPTRDESVTEDPVKLSRQEVKANPNSAEAHYKLGMAYAEASDHAAAVESYKNALRLDPEFFFAHTSLGVAYGALGRPDDAVKAFETAIRMKPDFVNAYWALAVFHERAGRNEEALNAWMRAANTSTDLAELNDSYVNIASVLERLGRYEGAIEAYKKLLDIDKQLSNLSASDEKPAPPILHAWRIGHLYEKLGRNEEAAEAYIFTLSLDTSTRELNWVYIDLGKLYEKMGRNQEAIEAYNKAIEMRPDWTRARVLLGLLHVKLKDKEAALREYGALKRIDPQEGAELLKKIESLGN